jgi:hypothetical protein
MDILNWLYIRKQQLIKTEVNDASTDLLVLGADVPFTTRGDGYQTYGMTVNDFATSVTSIIKPNVGLFSQTEDGPIVTNTTAETSVVGNGVGTLSVPANTFKVGDSFHAKLIGHLSCNAAATIRIYVKSGTVELADTGVIDLDATTDRHWEMNIYFTVRELGDAGVASIASGGLFSYIKDAGVNFEGTNFSIVNNTDFETTTLNDLDITVKWGAANAANIIYTEIFTLNKTF